MHSRPMLFCKQPCVHCCTSLYLRLICAVTACVVGLLLTSDSVSAWTSTPGAQHLLSTCLFACGHCRQMPTCSLMEAVTVSCTTLCLASKVLMLHCMYTHDESCVAHLSTCASYGILNCILWSCEQGDREQEAGLPVSPLMDRRNKGGITRSQVRRIHRILCYSDPDR